jgi:four helix bundle protein
VKSKGSEGGIMMMTIGIRRGSVVAKGDIMEIRSHRDLIVWQRAMELATEVHLLTRKLPATEKFGLAPQLRRSASSIAANIAEGAGRFHRGDYLRFVSIARGSLMEVDTHLEMGVLLGYFTGDEAKRAAALSNEVLRMLTKLARVLAERAKASAK